MLHEAQEIKLISPAKELQYRNLLQVNVQSRDNILSSASPASYEPNSGLSSSFSSRKRILRRVADRKEAHIRILKMTS